MRGQPTNTTTNISTETEGLPLHTYQHSHTAVTNAECCAAGSGSAGRPDRAAAACPSTTHPATARR